MKKENIFTTCPDQSNMAAGLEGGLWGKQHVSLEWSTVYALFMGILNSFLKRRKKYRYDLFGVSTLKSLVEL